MLLAGDGEVNDRGEVAAARGLFGCLAAQDSQAFVLELQAAARQKALNGHAGAKQERSGCVFGSDFIAHEQKIAGSGRQGRLGASSY